MRRLLVAPVMMLAVAPAAAQDPILLEPGTRIRVQTMDRRYVTGALVATSTDAVVLALDGDSVRVPRDSVHRLETSVGQGFLLHRALVQGGIGVLSGAAIGLVISSDTKEDQAVAIAASAASFGLTGFVLGGGGDYAKRGMLPGVLLGGAAGALIGASVAEPCDPSRELICFDEGYHVFAGALVGAAIGGLLGGTIGAVSAGEHWKKVRLDRVQLALAPGPAGVSATVRIGF